MKYDERSGEHVFELINYRDEIFVLEGGHQLTRDEDYTVDGNTFSVKTAMPKQITFQSVPVPRSQRERFLKSEEGMKTLSKVEREAIIASL